VKKLKTCDYYNFAFRKKIYFMQWKIDMSSSIYFIPLLKVENFKKYIVLLSGALMLMLRIIGAIR